MFTSSSPPPEKKKSPFIVTKKPPPKFELRSQINVNLPRAVANIYTNDIFVVVQKKGKYAASGEGERNDFTSANPHKTIQTGSAKHEEMMKRAREV